MSRYVDALGVIVLCAAIGAIGAWLCGCGLLSKPKAPDQALLDEAKNHQKELTACLTKALDGSGLYSEYKLCRDEVEQRYGIAVTDGGK